MVAGGLVRLAGKLMGPGLRAKVGGARGVKQLLGDIGASAGFNVAIVGGNQLLAGQFNPAEILAYTAADVLATGAGTLGSRALRGTRGVKTSSLKDPKTGKTQIIKEIQRAPGEGLINIGASIGAANVVGNALAGQQMAEEQGVNQAQERSVEAQKVQRAGVNGDPNLLLAGAYFPYTNNQNNENAPSPEAQFEQMLNDAMGQAVGGGQGRQLNALEQLMVNENLAMQQNARFAANARQIMGL